jgi:hypothetical protein
MSTIILSQQFDEALLCITTTSFSARHLLLTPKIEIYVGFGICNRFLIGRFCTLIFPDLNIEATAPVSLDFIVSFSSVAVDLTNDLVVASKQQQLQMQFFPIVFANCSSLVCCLCKKQTHVEK